MKVSDTKIKMPEENGQKDLLSPNNPDDSLNRKYSQVRHVKMFLSKDVNYFFS